MIRKSAKRFSDKDHAHTKGFMTVPDIKGSPVSFSLPPDANGILPDRMIAAMADAGLILPEYPFVESQIQPASLDLRLGDMAYRVRASFLPGPGSTGAKRIDELKL